MDPFEKVAKGTPLRGNVKADTWNAMLDCASAFARGKLNTAPGSAAKGVFVPALEVLVRNDTEADLDAGAAVGLGASVVSFASHPNHARGRPAFAGVSPTAGGPFAVLSEPLPAGAIGRAVVAGIAVTKVSGPGAYAAPVAGETGHLAGADAGPVRVLQRAAGSGPAVALVLVGGGAGGGVATSAPLFFVSGPVDPDTGYHPAQRVLSWDTAEDEAVLEEAEVWWAPASGECGLIPGYYFGMPTGGTVGVGEDEALAYVGESAGQVTMPGRLISWTETPVCNEAGLQSIVVSNPIYEDDIILRAVGLAIYTPPPPPPEA